LRSCEGIIFYRLFLSKDKTGFSLRAVIHEFFQKKLNYIKATKFFLYDPLTKSFIRLRRDYTVLKKALSMERFDILKNTPTPH